MKKTVTIKRRPNTTNLPDHIYESAKRRIGSTFNASGDVNTGLTNKELKQFMPEILGVDTTDSSFFRQVKKYFMDLTIDVPTAGVDFEIGTDEDGDPNSVMDYIRYKFAIAHPYVLLDTEDKAEVQKKKHRYAYVVQDLSKVKKLKVSQQRDRKKALTEYIKLTADEKRMDNVLRVLGLYPDTLDTEEKEVQLEKLCNESPSKFYTAATDKNLEMRAFIENCLSSEVLRKVGNTYFDGEVPLGDTMEDTILFLKDKKNSETLLTLKARLKEFQK